MVGANLPPPPGLNRVKTVDIAKSFSSIQTVGNAKMQTVGDAKNAKSFISSEWKIPVGKTMPTAALL